MCNKLSCHSKWRRGSCCYIKAWCTGRETRVMVYITYWTTFTVNKPYNNESESETRSALPKKYHAHVRHHHKQQHQGSPSDTLTVLHANHNLPFKTFWLHCIQKYLISILILISTYFDPEITKEAQVYNQTLCQEYYAACAKRCAQSSL